MSLIVAFSSGRVVLTKDGSSRVYIDDFLNIAGVTDEGNEPLTRAGALNALLPSQDGQTGRVLGSVNGDAAWVAQTGGGGGSLGATLTAIELLDPTANTVIYATGTNVFSTTPFTAGGRALVGAADPIAYLNGQGMATDAEVTAAIAAKSDLITVQDEGVALTGAATVFNFVGPGVSVAGTGATKTVTIPGATGGITDGDKGEIIVSSSGAVWNVDINGATEDTAPTFANDFVLTYDASAGANRKVRLSNMPGNTPLDPTLVALAGLSTVADQMIYATGPDAFQLSTLTAFIRTLLDDADAATARTTLGTMSSAAIATAIEASVGEIVSYGVVIPTPVVGDEVMLPRAAFPHRIFQGYRRTSSGTATVSVRKNGTNVTGLGAMNASTTSTAVLSATANNDVAVGDEIVAQITAVSSAAALRVQVDAVRT